MAGDSGPALAENNGHAGQGSVVLDIGGEVGALIVAMPAAFSGQEVELRPAGEAVGAHHHRHHPHVAVLARPTPAGPAHAAVFAALDQGEYELYLRPHGPVMVRAAVSGGAVTFTDWPA
jgi:hypothetical protein